MHFSALAKVSLGLVAIQTAAAAATMATLPQLIQQLPACAVSCFEEAAISSGCKGAADFNCVCSPRKMTQLITQAGSCIGLGSNCDLSKAALVASQICATIANNPSESDLASASAVASSALATATTTTKNAAPKPTAVAMAAMGVVAAYAVLGL
ncbi:hypothetical protein GQ53DRAFT_826183 [Thozetella sp. PMI_491]|nr:hypothetical protein GQ53DRAFT_826183 [Thozetella sp. PMI_491]